MEVPVVALAARITRSTFGGRRSHPFVSFYASQWWATTGWIASAVCNRVATSFRTPMIPRWSCGDGLGITERLTSVKRWNQTRACLSARRDSGAAMTRVDLTATSWRKAKTLPQSSAMVVNVLETTYFVLPRFAFASTASIVTTLSLSLASSALLLVSSSFAHSVLEREKS